MECPDNKLFQINPTVGDFYVWTGLSRREEIVITRARIGHTYFTHSYLLKGEDALVHSMSLSRYSQAYIIRLYRPT